jgi:CTP synthase (UTP-ammonia lyase)
VQFHPEFQSRPLKPHPLFASFVEAAKRHKQSDGGQPVRVAKSEA